MKRTYHLCLSAGNEVMFRDQEDYNRGFNTFALALHKTNSTGLVEAFMSTHYHLIVQTDDPKAFMHAMRQPYSKYFNRKYFREGLLGEKHHFQIEAVGIHHHLAAMSYVLRNPLHHGIAPTPYAYHNSSANAIYQKEMGRFPEETLLAPKSYYKYIGRHAEVPSHYKMSTKGVFLRESVLDIRQVENMFMTPRTFEYYMNRKSSEEWRNEQLKDDIQSKIIGLEDIEHGIYIDPIETLLRNENGRGNFRNISDIELCTMIDHKIVPSFGKESIYTLSTDEQIKIAKELANEIKASPGQIKRCLNIL